MTPEELVDNQKFLDDVNNMLHVALNTPRCASCNRWIKQPAERVWLDDDGREYCDAGCRDLGVTT